LEKLPPLAAAQYRFCRIPLAAGIDPTQGQTGEQIGRLLWHSLAPERTGVPDDFVARHLLVAPGQVQVWSRAGIAAAEAGDGGPARELERQFCDLILQAAEVGRLAAGDPVKDEEIAASVDAGRALSRKITLWRQQLSYPENRVLRRFFEATSLADVLRAVHDTNNSLAASLLGRRLDANVGYLASVQNTAEWLELFIVSFYSLYLAHMLAETLHFPQWYKSYGVLIVAILSAATLAIGLRPWAEHHAHAHVPSHGLSRLARTMLLVAFILAAFIVAGLTATVQSGGGKQQQQTTPAGAH
jgi:hypothetical protein